MASLTRPYKGQGHRDSGGVGESKLTGLWENRARPKKGEKGEEKKSLTTGFTGGTVREYKPEKTARVLVVLRRSLGGGEGIQELN